MKIQFDKIIELFPHTTITQISGLSTYIFMSSDRLKLNTNDVSIHSHLGNSELGLLLSCFTQEFEHHVHCEIHPPTKPRPDPTIDEKYFRPSNRRNIPSVPRAARQVSVM